MVTLLINVPLLLAGIKWGGGLRFFIRTIFAVVVMTVAIDILNGRLLPIDSDPLLYTLFGGLLDGIGIGLVLRGSGTTGGTDIVAQLLARYRGGYTHTPRPALYVVVYRSQVTLLKRIIADVDPNAFVVVSEAHEVLGEGFRSVVAA